MAHYDMSADAISRACAARITVPPIIAIGHAARMMTFITKDAHFTFSMGRYGAGLPRNATRQAKETSP